ncbi:major outer membrane lipoprotein [Vibrio inusitatus NBRC 102082]|uniref:Major outer membrane lipoprotein Lpp n=1 Tax=Vibrio inusitatus NBRC 102082 TaxID=1219070 RepID=A0A4Y3HVD2_9VIBR|nr:Lpp/OprI family alanine-zipper lipoprotein [Vibrio inusitatus]GEA50700.1 major outer membrane lipoprotein [Vibrio inusitatus NBRC 102082]
MNNKFLLIAGVSSVLLLAGCASGPDEETTAKMADQDARVSQLEQDVAALKAAHENDADSAMEAKQAKEAAMAAQDEAARANERLDNIAQSYTK